MSRTFLAQFGHDARGSIGSIRLLLGVLLEDVQDDAQREMLVALDGEARRLASCINALPIAAEPTVDAAITIDLVPLLRVAGTNPALTGVAVQLVLPESARIAVREPVNRIGDAVCAVLALAAGAQAAIVVTAQLRPTRVAISGGEQWPMASHLLERLAARLGASLHVDAAQLTLEWSEA